MSSTPFNKRLIISREEMSELTPEVYKEVVKYNVQNIKYITQAADPCSYKENKYRKAA